MRSAVGTFLIALLWMAPARAQDVARFSIDSTLAIDTVRGDNAVHRPNIIGDITGVVCLGSEWVVCVRPWFRQPRNDTWNKEIY